MLVVAFNTIYTCLAHSFELFGDGGGLVVESLTLEPEVGGLIPTSVLCP